jgi:hypothetical protein
MSRAHIMKVLQNPDGSVMTGASVRVLADGASVDLPDPLYTTDAGSSTVSNPFTSTDGRVEFYLDNPQRLQIGITPAGGTESFITADAMPDAANAVVADVHLSLGTPAPNSYPHVNSSGQIEYVAVAGSTQRPISAKTADYAPTSTVGEVVLMSGSHTVTLPAPSSDNRGCIYTVKNTGTGTVTVHAASGTIDGGAAFTMTVQYSSADFINDGTNWFTV